MSKFNRKMTIGEAREWASRYNRDNMTDEQFESVVNQWSSYSFTTIDNDYSEIRSILVSKYQEAIDSFPGIKYRIDMTVGLSLYMYLKSSGFTLCEANNDHIWTYFSIQVAPDLTYLRFPDPETADKKRGDRINSSRFYGDKRRIWLKTLWWYVYLSWQGDEQSTSDVLQYGGADILSHFIETPGRGYRVDMYRAFMREYSRSERKGAKYFNGAMKLSGARCKQLEPELHVGGVEGYCRELFADYARQVERREE